MQELRDKARGRPHAFYGGLAFAVEAFSHWSKGNPVGALSLYQASSRRLSRFRPHFLGVDVERFLKQYTELFRWMRRYPVRYDGRLVPTIRWTSPAAHS